MKSFFECDCLFFPRWVNWIGKRNTTSLLSFRQSFINFQILDRAIVNVFSSLKVFDLTVFSILNVFVCFLHTNFRYSLSKSENSLLHLEMKFSLLVYQQSIVLIEDILNFPVLTLLNSRFCYLKHLSCQIWKIHMIFKFHEEEFLYLHSNIVSQI